MKSTSYDDVQRYTSPSAKYNSHSPSVVLGVPPMCMSIDDAQELKVWPGDNKRYRLLLRVDVPANAGTRSAATGATWFYTSDMPFFEAAELVNMAIAKGLIHTHMPRYTPGATESAAVMRAVVNAPYKPPCTDATRVDEGDEGVPKKRKKKEKTEKKPPKYKPIAMAVDPPPGSELLCPPKKGDEVLARDADGDWYNARVFHVVNLGTTMMASVHFFGWPKDQDITWTYGDGNIRRPHTPLPFLAVKLKMSEEEEDDVEDPEPRENEELETSPLPPPEPEPDAAIPHKKKFKIVTRPNPDAFRDWNASSEDESYVTDDD